MLVENIKNTIVFISIDECVLAVESEDKMRIYDCNDDFSNLIDKSIFSPEVCDAYHNGEKYEWVIKVGNEFLRDGLKRLNRKQLTIIEALFFEGKCIQDICNKYCLSHDEVLSEIRDMRITLVRYM